MEIGKKLKEIFRTPAVLEEERRAVENANTEATVTGKPQRVKVGGEEFTVTDDGAGRQTTKV